MKPSSHRKTTRSPTPRSWADRSAASAPIRSCSTAKRRSLPSATKTASFALDQVTLDIIVSTGIVSNMMTTVNDYYYNSTLAHCVYYGSTVTEHGHHHLHGEVVSLGVLCLLEHAGQFEEEDRLMQFNDSIGLPVCSTTWKSRNPSSTKWRINSCRRPSGRTCRRALRVRTSSSPCAAKTPRVVLSKPQRNDLRIL